MSIIYQLLLEALKEYYQCPYFDIHCSDVTRICFESYDPYLTINQNSAVWDTIKEYQPIVYSFEGAAVDEQKTIEILLKWWLKKFGLHSGARNVNVFKLCAAFNDYGVRKEYAKDIAFTFQQEGFRQKEIEVIVNSAYRKTEKFGTLKFSQNG